MYRPTAGRRMNPCSRSLARCSKVAVSMETIDGRPTSRSSHNYRIRITSVDPASLFDPVCSDQFVTGVKRYIDKVKVKVNFEIYIADQKASIPVYRRSFFCSAVLTQHYHWYAATRFAFPGGYS